MKKLTYLFSIVLISFSCGPRERISKEVFEEVSRSMEVKKLNESDIIQEAMVWGEEISKEAQEQLMNTLKEAIAEQGVSGAVKFCNTEALPILKEVSEKYGVEIRRASTRYRNPKDQPTSEEGAILEAYEYSIDQEMESGANIQKVQDGEVYLFTKAIIIPNALCLNCHGQPGEEINPETMETLKELYPEDKAVGHVVGGLRGMWSIKLPKKEVIKRI
jgi:hypothetical protein